MAAYVLQLYVSSACVLWLMGHDKIGLRHMMLPAVRLGPMGTGADLS